jgi:hypothetical protein
MSWTSAPAGRRVSAMRGASRTLFGRGIIDCGAGRDVLYVSLRAQRNYKIRHCDTISHATLGN